MKIDHDHHLDVLLQELAEARDDDRYTLSQYPVIITAAVTLIAGMAALYATTYPEGSPPPDSKLFAVPVWVYVATPTLPILLISYAVLVSILGTLRSYYERVIERRIHEVISEHRGSLPFPSWAHLQLEVTGQAHAEPEARLNWLLVYGMTGLLVLGGCIALASKIPNIRYRLLALVLNGGLMFIPISAAVLSVARGSRLWDGAVTRLRARLLRTDSNFQGSGKADERSLASYLLLPRNQEELIKGFFVPVSLLIGRILATGIPQWTWGVQNWDSLHSGFWHFLGFFFAFEFLVYQARYLLNDVRDRKIDCRKELSKHRFPCSWVKKEIQHKDLLALKAAFGSFIARLAAAALIVGCILPYKNGMWIWHSAFLLGVFLIAWLYEVLRDRCNKAKGKSQVGWTVAVIGAVGLGYGLRSLVGLWLAGVESAGALLLVAAGGSLFGSTFVGLTWALEATRAPRPVLAADKAHLVLFHDAVSRIAKRRGISVTASQKVLAVRQHLAAPWCISVTLSTAVLAAFVLHLLWANLSIVQMLLPAAAAAGIVALAAVLPLNAAWCLTGLDAVSTALVLHWLSASITQSIVAALVCTLPLIVTSIFRGMSYEDLPDVMDKVRRVVGAGCHLLFRWFVQERKREAFVQSSLNRSVGEP